MILSHYITCFALLLDVSVSRLHNSLNPTSTGELYRQPPNEILLFIIISAETTRCLLPISPRPPP